MLQLTRSAVVDCTALIFARPACAVRQPVICLLCAQDFTTSAAIWQDSAAGLNPLMQTPTPAGQVPASGAEQAPLQTAQAVLRKTKISPKKLNEFAKLVRRKHIDDALVQCQVAPNKAAKLCYKVCI